MEETGPEATPPAPPSGSSKIKNYIQDGIELIKNNSIYILPALFILALIVIVVEAVKNPKNKGLKWAAYSLGVIIPLVLLSLYLAIKYNTRLGAIASADGIKNAMLILMILFLIITLTLDILAFLNPKNKSLQVSAVTFTILFFTAFIGYVGQEFFKGIFNYFSDNIIWKIFTIAIGLGVFSTILYFIFRYVFPPSGTPPELITGRILEWILLIGALAIAGGYFVRSKSWVIQLIMNLPCLFYNEFDDLMKFLREQYNFTTKTQVILLSTEIGLLALYMFLSGRISKAMHRVNIKPPSWFSWFDSAPNYTLLQKTPVYLSTLKTIGTYENLASKQLRTKQEKYDYHYSISAQFTINPQPPSTSPGYREFLSILDYGGKPSVQYRADKNLLRVIVDVKQPGSSGASKEVIVVEKSNILLQRWNNLVINYSNGTMDVFLNGELIGSQNNIMPFMNYEVVSVGNDNGIHGAIRDVRYYPEPLSLRQINNL
jgi:hypothetical protein